jgi:hypothetical protein
MTGSGTVDLLTNPDACKIMSVSFLSKSPGTKSLVFHTCGKSAEFIDCSNQEEMDILFITLGASENGSEGFNIG